MLKEDCAYCAGTIDNDGSIFISKMKKGKQYTPALVVVCDSNREYVEKLAKTVELPESIQIHSRLSHIGKKPTYVLESERSPRSKDY